MNQLDYSIALSNALRVYQLTHAVYDVLACVAKFQSLPAHEGSYGTYPRISNALGCTFNNIQIHVSRNPVFFQVDTGHAIRRLRLTPEAIELLRKIKTRIDRTPATSPI